MKSKKTIFLKKDENLKALKLKRNHKIVGEYSKEMGKECEKNLSKFC